MPILVLLWNSPIIKQLPCVYRLQTRLFLCKSHCVSLSTNNASKNTNYRNYCRLCVSLGVSRAAHWAVLLTHQGWSPISDISLEVLWLRLVVIVIIVYVYWDFAMVLMMTMMKKEDVTEPLNCYFYPTLLQSFKIQLKWVHLVSPSSLPFCEFYYSKYLGAFSGSSP